jgi:hypothetical protein
MPQQQIPVPLHVGVPAVITGLEAVATGNNAAWLCPCGYPRPLIGRTGLVSGPTPATEVQCDACRRRYYVLPDGYDQARVLRVEQVGGADA